MSDTIDKLTSKKFSSSSISHVANYPLIKTINEYVLSFSILNTLYQQLYSYLDVLNESVISKNKPIYDSLNFIDSNFDRIILSRVDVILKNSPDLSPYYPNHVYHSIVGYLNKKYLGPINNYIYNTYDQYLPATLTENKASFKLDELTAGSPESIKTEVYKFFKIFNEFLLRSRYFVSSKSNDVSESLISTYNKELEKLGEEGNAYYKSGQASINAGFSLFNNVNSDYIQPLKTQTQGYVSDAKTKADSYFTDAKKNITSTIQKETEVVDNKTQDFLNGSAPVRASA